MKGNDKNKKRKIEIEEKVVLITNTIGSWVVAAFFSNLDSIVGMLLAIYFVFNFICFITLIKKYH